MDNLDNLWSALAGIPRLPNAACRGESDLFDQTDDPGAIDLAVRICHDCQELFACKQWASTLPANALHGVVAGQYHEWVSHPSLRRKKLAAR